MSTTAFTRHDLERVLRQRLSAPTRSISREALQALHRSSATPYAITSAALAVIAENLVSKNPGLHHQELARALTQRLSTSAQSTTSTASSAYTHLTQNAARLERVSTLLERLRQAATIEPARAGSLQVELDAIQTALAALKARVADPQAAQMLEPFQAALTEATRSLETQRLRAAEYLPIGANIEDATAKLAALEAQLRRLQQGVAIPVKVQQQSLNLGDGAGRNTANAGSEGGLDRGGALLRGLPTLRQLNVLSSRVDVQKMLTEKLRTTLARQSIPQGGLAHIKIAALAQALAAPAALATIIKSLVAKNSGGMIPGAGPDQDTVLVAATPGEFMLRRHAVETLGVEFLTALNRVQSHQDTARVLTQHVSAAISQDDIERVARHHFHTALTARRFTPALLQSIRLPAPARHISTPGLQALNAGGVVGLPSGSLGALGAPVPAAAKELDTVRFIIQDPRGKEMARGQTDRDRLRDLERLLTHRAKGTL